MSTTDYHVRVWDPDLKVWVLHDTRPNEEAARRLGRVLWRAGAAGIQISVREPRIIVETKR